MARAPRRKNPIRRYLPHIAVTVAALAIAAVVVPRVLNGGPPALPADVQVLGDAIQTAKDASSYHLTASETVGGDTIAEDVRVVTGKGLEGSASFDGQKADIVVIGTDMYMKAGLDFWLRFTGPDASARAQAVAGQWIKITSNEVPAGFADLENQSHYFDEILTSASRDTLTNSGATTYNGQAAIAIVDSSYDGGTFYVSATTPAYPIALVANGSDATLSYDGWDVPVTLTAPPGAIEPSQLPWSAG